MMSLLPKPEEREPRLVTRSLPTSHPLDSLSPHQPRSVKVTLEETEHLIEDRLDNTYPIYRKLKVAQDIARLHMHHFTGEEYDFSKKGAI